MKAGTAQKVLLKSLTGNRASERENESGRSSIANKSQPRCERNRQNNDRVKFRTPLNFLTLLGFAVRDGDAEDGLGFFGWLCYEGFFGFGGVVVAPQPDHFGGKFGGAVGGIVSSLPEAEMEIVFLGLEGVGHAEIG